MHFPNFRDYDCILIECTAFVRYVVNDKLPEVLKTLTLRNSGDIITSCKIMLNNVIISDEIDIDKANLINFILNNSNTNITDYRNMMKIVSHEKNDSTTNRFFIRSNILQEDNGTNTAQHELVYRFPIFLKDINDFFRKIDIINNADFDINISYKNPFIISRANSSFKLNIAYLYANEISLNNSDNIKYLKMLDTGCAKRINYLENNVRLFSNITDGKKDFNIHNA